MTVEQAWRDYERSFADPDGGWGPPNAISSLTEEWKAEATVLTQVIADCCSEEQQRRTATEHEQ